MIWNINAIITSKFDKTIENGIYSIHTIVLLDQKHLLKLPFVLLNSRVQQLTVYCFFIRDMVIDQLSVKI